MSHKSIFIIIAVILIAGSVFSGYLIGVKSTLYQGKTARDWAADYADNEHIINLSHNCQQVYKDASARKLTMDEFLACGQAPTPTLEPSPVQTTAVEYTSSYRQTFMNICKTGVIYCTCLYDVMSQNYSDAEIQNEIDTKGANVLYSGYGSNGQESSMVINALAECNSRFDAK